MDIKKLLLSTIGAGVVMLGLSLLWHVVLMSDLYASDISRPEPIMYLIVGSYFGLALVMSYMYPKGIEGTNKIANGLKFGALIGIIWIVPLSVIMYAATVGTPIKVIGIDAIWHIVEGGIGGVVIAMIYGLPSNGSSS
jgi:hypothetical protein